MSDGLHRMNSVLTNAKSTKVGWYGWLAAIAMFAAFMLTACAAPNGAGACPRPDACLRPDACGHACGSLWPLHHLRDLRR